MGIGRLKNYIFKLTPNKILKFYQEPVRKKFLQEQEFANLSYSQEGEDLILNRFLENRAPGFYIDIGAHHPKRFSNTYNFYKKGWRGINIDAMPGSMDAFNIERPKDINLEIAIGEEEIELNYFNFKEKALNTFSEVLANQYKLGGWELNNVISIKTYPLNKILEEYLPINKTIDFFSIDVEGFELEVLKSNNWDKFKPKIILIEMLDCKIDDIYSTEVGKFLAVQGYVFFAKTINTVFFIH